MAAAACCRRSTVSKTAPYMPKQCMYRIRQCNASPRMLPKARSNLIAVTSRRFPSAPSAAATRVQAYSAQHITCPFISSRAEWHCPMAKQAPPTVHSALSESGAQLAMHNFNNSVHAHTTMKQLAACWSAVRAGAMTRHGCFHAVCRLDCLTVAITTCCTSLSTR